MQKWEYKTITHYWDKESANFRWSDIPAVANSSDALETRLNQLHLEGWELISYEEISPAPHSKTHYHLKRIIE